MSRGRLEAFSDGVIAILITIMVLELKVPQGSQWSALIPLIPVFLCYLLSFIFLGIYWNNHHHLLQATERIDGRVLWANLHLLFWLSLIPFVTAWMGENNFAPQPVALYGGVLLGSAAAYYLLVRALLAVHDQHSLLVGAIGSDFKGRISLVFYLLGIPLSFFSTWIAYGLYVVVAVIWLVPDQRIERLLLRSKANPPPR
jgi:uncharacterized membrane protein